VDTALPNQAERIADGRKATVLAKRMANQFGDNGAKSVAAAATKTLKPGATEADFLAAVGRETVVRVARQYGAASAEARSTSNRREAMRTSKWLADVPAVFA